MFILMNLMCSIGTSFTYVDEYACLWKQVWMLTCGSSLGDTCCIVRGNENSFSALFEGPSEHPEGPSLFTEPSRADRDVPEYVRNHPVQGWSPRCRLSRGFERSSITPSPG